MINQFCRAFIVSVVCWVAGVEAAWAQAPQETYDFTVAKGLVEFGRGHYEVAARMFERALQSKPHDFEASDYLGQTYLRLKKYREAERLFEELSLATPQSSRAWLGLGIARSQQGKYREALDALKQAERQDPDNPMVFFYQGLVAHELKSFNQAP